MRKAGQTGVRMSDVPCFIGISAVGNGNFLGRLDDVRVYKQAISPGDATAIALADTDDISIVQALSGG
jgi:hypothetical protein